MVVWVPVVLAVLVFVCSVLLGVALCEDNGALGIPCFIIGTGFVVILAIAPIWNPSGLPLSDINPGTYKVAVVYVAGENVNIAIEWKLDAKDTQEKICYYQFKKDAFEGVLNPNSKKLVVVKTGSFKKLRLE